MKRETYYNLFLGIACSIFIAYGASNYLIRFDHLPNYSKTDNSFQNNISAFMTENLKYYNDLIELNAIKKRLIGNRVIQKSDYTLAVSDSGSIIPEEKKEYATLYLDSISALKELQTVSEEEGAHFLFCVAPNKGNYEKAPANIDNYAKQNYDLFLSELDKAEITNFDLSEVLEKQVYDFDLYYYTDHHWTSRTGFYVHKAILEELKKRYGFEYESYISDIENYNIKTYSDWFLGSYGKKTGLHFTWRGADDFELITPKFNTSLKQMLPFKDYKVSGPFEDTVIFSYMLAKNYYNKITYNTYCGGDFRLQIVENQEKINGKKVLLIRDSFACVVAPFLSLQTKELHICDMRQSYIVGKKINIREYIEKIKPDYVLVLFSGTTFSNDERYDFF